MYVISMGTILGIVMVGLMIIGKWDKPLPLDGRKYFCIFAGAILESGIILVLAAGEPIRNKVLLSVLGGCLLLASLTDITICQVHNFVWWFALAALAVFWQCEVKSQGTAAFMEMLQSLLFFAAVQFVLFRRMYGRADCYAFCVCAAGEAARGIGAVGFLLHMLLAYIFLFPVQAIRGNINKKGNLKTPVPFLPYISISFWVIIALKKWLCQVPLFGIM